MAQWTRSVGLPAGASWAMGSALGWVSMSLLGDGATPGLPNVGTGSHGHQLPHWLLSEGADLLLVQLPPEGARSRSPIIFQDTCGTTAGAGPRPLLESREGGLPAARTEGVQTPRLCTSEATKSTRQVQPLLINSE